MCQAGQVHLLISWLSPQSKNAWLVPPGFQRTNTSDWAQANACHCICSLDSYRNGCPDAAIYNRFIVTRLPMGSVHFSWMDLKTTSLYIKMALGNRYLESWLIYFAHRDRSLVSQNYISIFTLSPPQICGNIPIQ